MARLQLRGTARRVAWRDVGAAGGGKGGSSRDADAMDRPCAAVGWLVRKWSCFRHSCLADWWCARVDASTQDGTGYGYPLLYPVG